MKNGLLTTEFWVTAIVNVVAAVVALIAARGLITQEEGELWVVLAQSLVMMIAPIVMAYTTVRYTQARTDLKKNNGK
jgi:hypothetical protein